MTNHTADLSDALAIQSRLRAAASSRWEHLRDAVLLGHDQDEIDEALAAFSAPEWRTAQ